jgi:allophanate hydrolase subunit 1
MKPRLLPLGDSSLLIRFGDEIEPALNQCVHELDALLREDQIPGVIETIPPMPPCCFIMILWF